MRNIFLPSISDEFYTDRNLKIILPVYLFLIVYKNIFL